MFIDALLFIIYLLQCYTVTAISVILYVAVQTAYTLIKEKV
jgi:hypothetical protein